MFEFRTSAKYHISWGCCCSSSTSCAFARTNITQLRWLIDLYLYIDINKRIQALRLIYYLSLSDVVRWVLDFLYYFFLSICGLCYRGNRSIYKYVATHRTHETICVLFFLSAHLGCILLIDTYICVSMVRRFTDQYLNDAFKFTQ